MAMGAPSGRWLPDSKCVLHIHICVNVSETRWTVGNDGGRHPDHPDEVTEAGVFR